MDTRNDRRARTPGVNLAKSNVAPQQTVDTLKEDMRWAREQTS